MLDKFPRVPLAHLPTPLEYLPRLSAELGGPQIYVKRDDCTGLATGGNKTRKLEFVLADALAQGADTLVTGGGPQSNHSRQTAAAAATTAIENIRWLSLTLWPTASITRQYFKAANTRMAPTRSPKTTNCDSPSRKNTM